MARSYRHISPKLAHRTKLVMTDVDGIMTATDGSLSSTAVKAIRKLEGRGIVVGLVSGRTLPGLELLCRDFGIRGPIIAENGGVAKLRVDGELVDLGYSREPALRALDKLKEAFPDVIKEREDNKDRMVDIVFWSHGVGVEQLMEHLDDTELVDSGYILHLVQKGVSKGKTLMELLDKIGDRNLSPAEIMVFGDSPTDISLFELFSNSVLIINPQLPVEQRQTLQELATYMSDLPAGEGLAEVISHITDIRERGNFSSYIV